MQKTLDFDRNPAHIPPLHTRSRIKINAKLIRVVQIIDPHRMWVQFDTSKIHDPYESRNRIYDDLFRRTSGGEAECYCAQPIWMIGGSTLLVKRLLLGAIDESLQHNRAADDSGEGAWSHLQKVAYDIELRQLYLLGEVKFVWMGDSYIVLSNRQQLLVSLFTHARLPAPGSPPAIA
jgi:hypothetical protein